MYCQRCGTEIPKTGSFCPKCGNQAYDLARKPISQTNSTPEPADQSCATLDVNLDTSAEDGHKKANRSRKALAIGIAIASIMVAFSALVLFGVTTDPNALRKNEPRHIPTIAEIAQLSNSIEGEKLSFKEAETEVYEEAYTCLSNGTDCGKLFLRGASEDVGIYIEKSAPNAQLVFAQLSVGATMACDPALSIDEAKSIVNAALKDEQTVNNDVTYRTYTKSDRYIFRMDIPEERTPKK